MGKRVTGHGALETGGQAWLRQQGGKAESWERVRVEETADGKARAGRSSLCRDRKEARGLKLGEQRRSLADEGSCLPHQLWGQGKTGCLSLQSRGWTPGGGELNMVTATLWNLSGARPLCLGGHPSSSSSSRGRQSLSSPTFSVLGSCLVTAFRVP